MPESTFTSIGAALGHDTVWVGLKDATSPWFELLSKFLFVLLGAGIALGFDLWRDHRKRIQRSAMAWSMAAEQIRIVLDRTHEHLRQHETSGNLSASELYWIPEIAQSFYQSCPNLDVIHNVRQIDEIVHQFNFNIREGRPENSLGFARDYYVPMKQQFNTVRTELSRFLDKHRSLVRVIVPKDVPDWKPDCN